MSGPTISRRAARWKRRPRPGATRPRRGIARLRVLVDVVVDPVPIRCSQVRVAFSYPAFARVRREGGAVWLSYRERTSRLDATTTPPAGWAGEAPAEILDGVAIHVDEAVGLLLVDDAVATVRWLPWPIGRLSAAWGSDRARASPLDYVAV